MRKVLLGSASVVGAGLLAAATFAGCAAGDVPADVSQGVEATEAAPVGAKLPNATASGTMDAGKDAARVDAGVKPVKTQDRPLPSPARRARRSTRSSRDPAARAARNRHCASPRTVAQGW